MYNMPVQKKKNCRIFFDRIFKMLFAPHFSWLTSLVAFVAIKLLWRGR